MKARIAFLLAACAWAGCLPRPAPAPPPPPPPDLSGGLAALLVPDSPPPTYLERNEMRAGWVVGWRQMTSTAAIDAALDWAEAARLNTLFVQVRVSGDAYYRSALVPRAETLRLQPETFDPLDYALKRGHARGFKIHAWMNTGILWRSSAPPASPEHAFNAHPDWVMRDAEGKPAFPDVRDSTPSVVETFYWGNWGHPGFQKHLADVAAEVAERYPVDGIHLDFVRFPARMGPRTPGAGYDPVSLERFRAETGEAPAEHTRAWDQWRTSQVMAAVGGIYRAVKSRRPAAEVSAAALGAWELAYGRSFTDYRKCLEAGILDFAVLMSYYKELPWVWKSLLNAKETADARRVVAGFQLSLHSPENVAQQIEMARDQDLRGFALFALDKEEAPDLPGYLAALRRLAIPDASDGRYSLRDPVWDRVGVIDAAHRSFSLRFFSRNGRSKLVIYPRGVRSLALGVNGTPLGTFALPAGGPLQLDISRYVNPFNREVAANHDFVLQASAEGPPDSRAQIFLVDYYAQP